MRKAWKTINVVGEGIAEYVNEMGRILLLLVDTFRWSCYPPFRLDLLYQQMERVGVRSVLVVTLTGAFSGMVLALQSFHATRAFGAETMVGVAVALSMTRELGPVLTSFMVTGRAGSAMAAEIGTMKVTEQIEAIRSMGTNPIRYLVAPRVSACLLLTPFLIIYADLLGIIGGFFVSVLQLGVNSGAYWSYSAQGVELWDVSIGVIKGFFFGGAIASISCYKGFHCREGAEGVGHACTEAFVASFISILALNFAMGVIFKAIYNTFWPLRVLL